MQFTQIALDERMRELTQHGAGDFPIQFYIDELFRFPGQCIPLHWHPELELWQARGGDVTVQLGTESLTLADGWAVFINADVLHSFRQADAAQALGCPNVVFRDELIAPVTSRIHRLYVAPLLAALPADMDAQERERLHHRLRAFSASANNALRLGSLFYMSALLYPEDHKPGQPDDMQVFIASLTD